MCNFTNKSIKAVKGLLILQLLLVVPLHALDTLSDIPDECTSNMATHSRKGSEIDIGPTWVTPCEDVCELGENGKVIGKKTVWFPARSCDPDSRHIVANLCVPSATISGCNEIQQSTSSPQSHDCWSNSPKEDHMWKCTEKSLPVTCKFKKDGKKQKYMNFIKYGYCEPAQG